MASRSPHLPSCVPSLLGVVEGTCGHPRCASAGQPEPSRCPQRVARDQKCASTGARFATRTRRECVSTALPKPLGHMPRALFADWRASEGDRSISTCTGEPYTSAIGRVGPCVWSSTGRCVMPSRSGYSRRSPYVRSGMTTPDRVRVVENVVPDGYAGSAGRKGSAKTSASGHEAQMSASRPCRILFLSQLCAEKGCLHCSTRWPAWVGDPARGRSGLLASHGLKRSASAF